MCLNIFMYSRHNWTCGTGKKHFSRNSEAFASTCFLDNDNVCNGTWRSEHRVSWNHWLIPVCRHVVVMEMFMTYLLISIKENSCLKDFPVISRNFSIMYFLNFNLMEFKITKNCFYTFCDSQLTFSSDFLEFPKRMIQDFKKVKTLSLKLN